MMNRKSPLGSNRIVTFAVAAGVFAALCSRSEPTPVSAQTPTQSCLVAQQPLLTMPEIYSDRVHHRLRATLRLKDGKRQLWGSQGDPRCQPQRLRYYDGAPVTVPGTASPMDPMPGPTFRSRVGDIVEITYFNQVDPKNFAATLDKGAVGTMESCDQFNQPIRGRGRKTQSAGGDAMPDCLHGSSTTNVHFHGTHTTPSTTGDNVLLFVRPALGTKPHLLPTEAETARIMAGFYAQCEQLGPPKSWKQMPELWQVRQRQLIQSYDRNLPHEDRLWPVNAAEIDHGLWPQYHIGAVPYCFRLPAFGLLGGPKMLMGQSPGTHWYHAHKHGSTALNVANGMTGAFIIEGKYDDDLNNFYGYDGANLKSRTPKLRQQVLMIQQLSAAPFPLVNGDGGPPGAGAIPRMSVNGRVDPLVTMRPGEVQLWRIVNGSYRDGVQFAYAVKNPSAQPPSAPCSPAPSSPPTVTVQWRQIAQDGVQFDVANYKTLGAANNQLNLAPANRADLLVKAPTDPGYYTVCVVRNNGLVLQYNGDPNDTTNASPGALPKKPSPLLTIAVTAPASQQPGYPTNINIPDANFPTFPAFLKDIGLDEIRHGRVLTFGPDHKTVDGKSFQDNHVDQTMTLNTAEEWVVRNEANDKMHPFHIHINPFQILELYEPNSPAILNAKPGDKCYLDTNDPTTFNRCTTVLPPPWVWWDTFAIPSGRQVDLTNLQVDPDCQQNCALKYPSKQGPTVAGCVSIPSCMAAGVKPIITPFIRCTGVGTPGADCVEYIPGWFRMRSRFVDFTGQYVLHCHILIHEDRGMMELIEVTEGKVLYTHH